MVRSTGSAHAPILWALTAVFALRLAGQAIQRCPPQALLPLFDRWPGSDTPYPVVLLLQLPIPWPMMRWRSTKVAERAAK